MTDSAAHTRRPALPRRALRVVVAALAVGVVASAATGCRRGGDEPASDGTGSQAMATETPEAAPAPRDAAPLQAPVVDTEPEPAQAPAERDLAVRLGLAPARPLVVSHLLTHPDVRELAGYVGELRVTSLEGVEPAPGYNTIRLAAGDGFGFALQLWRFDTERQAEARYARMAETYIIATADPTPVGDEAFASNFEGIRTYVFLHGDSRSVGAVSCQATLCTDGQIRALADRVASRL